MSRTDKDRRPDLQQADPLNRRFRMHGQDGTENWFWKKLAPATQCFCCSHRAWLPEKRRRRSSWKREVAWVLADMVQVAEDQAYWRKYAKQLHETVGSLVTDIDLSAENLERYFSFEYWSDYSDKMLGTVDFDGCYTTQTWEEH